IPVPSVSVGNASVNEGNSGTTSGSITVTLSAPAQSPVTVSWATIAGTATAGSDYVGGSGSLTFGLGGVMTMQIPLSVLGDVIYEPNETFTVRLSSPMNANLGTANGTVTITNDDAQPTVALAGTSLNGAEQGPTPIVFTITRTANLNGAI